MPRPTRAYPFHADWSRIAKLIVHQSLRIEAGERVLLHVDPNYFPELTEQVRIEVLRAGAVEVGALLRDSPGLDSVRSKLRRRERPELRLMEDKAQRALFDISDVYIWLPTSWNMAMYQTEYILTSWQGRSVHFHWITDVDDPAVFRQARFPAATDDRPYAWRKNSRHGSARVRFHAAGERRCAFPSRQWRCLA